MTPRIDLANYEQMYLTFDSAHDKTHMESVRNFALELANIHCPAKAELVWVAATLHDVGMSVDRKKHEIHGYELVGNDQTIKAAYTQKEVEEILEAIREHRASSGKPKGMVAKIVSDADKAADDTHSAFQRSYDWGMKHFPQINHQGQLLRSALQLFIKFGANGTGSKLFFDESKKRHDATYTPIFLALATDDLKAMDGFLSPVANRL